MERKISRKCSQGDTSKESCEKIEEILN
jgi:hypothetical protein